MIGIRDLLVRESSLEGRTPVKSIAFQVIFGVTPGRCRHWLHSKRKVFI